MSGSALPPRSPYVCVSSKSSDVTEDRPRDFLYENDVYFLFLHEVFQDRFLGCRNHAVNVEGWGVLENSVLFALSAFNQVLKVAKCNFHSTIQPANNAKLNARSGLCPFVILDLKICKDGTTRQSDIFVSQKVKLEFGFVRILFWVWLFYDYTFWYVHIRVKNLFRM